MQTARTERPRPLQMPAPKIICIHRPHYPQPQLLEQAPRAHAVETRRDVASNASELNSKLLQAAADFHNVVRGGRVTVVCFVPAYDVLHEVLAVGVDECGFAHVEFGGHELGQVTEMNLGHASCVACHTSHVKRHTSHVTRHTSHVTRHTSHVTHHTSAIPLTSSPPNNTTSLLLIYGSTLVCSSMCVRRTGSDRLRWATLGCDGDEG